MTRTEADRLVEEATRALQTIWGARDRAIASLVLADVDRDTVERVLRELAAAAVEATP